MYKTREQQEARPWGREQQGGTWLVAREAAAGTVGGGREVGQTGVGDLLGGEGGHAGQDLGIDLARCR